MSRLNKNPAGADWVNEPIVPDPADFVKAWANPGAVKPAYQLLGDRIWSIASGAHSLKQFWVDGQGQQVVNMPNGVLAVVAGGGLQVRVGQTFVDLDADGVRATRQGRNCLLAAGGVFWVNPPALPPSTDARLALYPENKPVAVACIQFTGPNQGVLRAGSIGIKSVTFDPPVNPTWIVVELAGPMASDVYSVVATGQLGFGNDLTLVQTQTCVMQVSRRTDRQFNLTVPTGFPALPAILFGEFVVTVYGRSA